MGGIAGALLPFLANLFANMLGSFLLVDRLGRRPLLLFGMSGMAVTLLVAGAATTARVEGAGGIAIACVIGYMTVRKYPRSNSESSTPTSAAAEANVQSLILRWSSASVGRGATARGKCPRDSNPRAESLCSVAKPQSCQS